MVVVSIKVRCSSVLIGPKCKHYCTENEPPSLASPEEQLVPPLLSLVSVDLN